MTPISRAYYASPAPAFGRENPESILGHLAQHHAHDLVPQQRNAWLSQIELLQKELSACPSGWIAFEFSIPRMGKRADAILLYNGIIFVLEFKIGATTFDRAAIDQVLDYALDLKNFHVASHDRYIVPVLVAPSAQDAYSAPHFDSDHVSSVVPSNGDRLLEQLNDVVSSLPAQNSIDPDQWTTSGYRPTPTIIEAAQALYRNHKVEDITRSDASARNLGDTTQCLSNVIEAAKRDRQKAICFVTGVPGAGKTLCGLNLVTERTKAHGDEHAVFLSGNGPLVEVLREALARDERVRSRELGQLLDRVSSVSKIKSFIQNIHHFRDASLSDLAPPIEHVAVFDEAQRAWDRGQLTKFMTQKKGIPNFEMSEPEFLIDVMNCHDDWCVIICLIGGGQEINTGEAGLTEWFAALNRRFFDWKIYTSQQLSDPDYNWGQDLHAGLQGLNVQQLPELHLSVSVRSFRAENQAAFVSSVVSSNAAEAKAIFLTLQESYPMALTRDLAHAKTWLRERARGTERFGIVASSGAHRLKPDAINVNDKVDAKNWFLSGKEDVRSSFYLEDVATEFDIQGLEIDWACVCWDADFRHDGNGWRHYDFRGTRWQSVNDDRRRIYLANAYRVLLTRARQGLVIYVPRGASDDPTRPPEFYDQTWQFLTQCGLSGIG